MPRIVELRPDLVIANEEENRAPDLAALRAGLQVLVTEVRDLPQALRELDRVLVGALGLARPGWLTDAEAAWARLEPGNARTAFVPVWRRPWMVLGRDTFAGDLLARLGVRNVYAGHPERYPRVPVEELAAHAAAISWCSRTSRTASRPRTGRKPSRASPAALVDGRHLTWYGPSLAEAPAVLAQALRAAR